jgi:hypothetical protein
MQASGRIGIAREIRAILVFCFAVLPTPEKIGQMLERRGMMH